MSVSEIAGYADAAWFESAFDSSECAEIVAAGGAWVTAPRVGIAPTYEQASVECDGLLECLLAYAADANRASRWGLAFGETAVLRLLRYRDGASIDWHWDRNLSRPDLPNPVLAVTVQLSSPADYTGGVLEIDANGTILHPPNAQGTVTAYTTACRHRATAVTAGERLVLVCFLTEPRVARLSVITGQIGS